MCDFISFNDFTVQWIKVSCIFYLQNNLKEFGYLHYSMMFRADWPKTSYLKAIDYWVILCYACVFIWLLEYCIILHLRNYTDQDRINSIKLKDTKYNDPKKKV